MSITKHKPVFNVYSAQSWSWVRSIHGLDWVGSEFFNFWWVGLGWVETWLWDSLSQWQKTLECCRK